MNMPGFTAQVSVYKVNGNYYTARFTNGVSRISEGVRLALGHSCHPERPGCFTNCMARCNDDPFYCHVNCHCECIGGPPCCEYQ
jgi:hypothetical protein